jgi:hypothetical protein
MSIEWVAPNATDTTFASTTRTQNSIYYSMQNGDASSMVERSEIAVDGTLILATANVSPALLEAPLCNL